MQNRDGTDVNITIDQKLEGVVGSESEYCICKVHDVLRNVNKGAYEPEIVAIGPFHRGKSHLQTMEEHKLRFLKLLLLRKNEKVSTYLDAMKPLEEEAQKCYAEPTDLSPDEFVEMMVLDGCFIIELLRKFKMLKDSGDNNDRSEEIKNDPLFRMDSTLNSLQRDLLLFENQLPFFILTQLYWKLNFPDETEAETVELPDEIVELELPNETVELPDETVELAGQENEFIYLALEFFNELFPGFGKRRKTGVAQDSIKHLLDLIHRNWSSEKLELNRYVTCKVDNINFIGSSTELAEAGIKFQKIDDAVSFDIQFSNGVLRIPVFTIEDRTESFLRNLIAYEQYCGATNCNIVTDYMTFFSCLIKSAQDVKKLSRRGIVRSFVGDHEVVNRMFSEMTMFITGPSRNFHYMEIFKRVNIHCERRWNKWMASLRRKYMHSPWAIISILVVFAFLVLALLQALFQILSWKHHS